MAAWRGGREQQMRQVQGVSDEMKQSDTATLPGAGSIRPALQVSPTQVCVPGFPRAPVSPKWSSHTTAEPSSMPNANIVPSCVHGHYDG